MTGLLRHAPTPRQILWGVLGAFVLLVVMVGIGYATTSIPSPNSFATEQATNIFYSDGTRMARLGQTNRVDVKLAQVPVPVQRAVLAAEDRNFSSEPGISPTGILRAMLTDIRGGDIQQGGSTITQQYVKNAYLTQARTFTRKFKEIFIAVKLGNTEKKSTILENYLNTIYFGRGAYGIQAASRAYFHKDVQHLDVAEGAVLAGVIRSPNGYDPQLNHAAAVSRWHYVVDGMVKKGWLTSDRASALRFPTVAAYKAGTNSSGCTGPTGFICQAVKADLARHGFSEQRLSAGGYRVYTTIDRKAQQAAAAAMASHNGGYQAGGVDKGREAALVTVQPGDGAIRAMYGGDKFCGEAQHRDVCTDLTGVSSNYARPPGSSFKPYTVIAALKEGISLDSQFSGPPSIQIGSDTINNSEGESCGRCSLTEALAKSINTIFVPLAQKVGPDKVATAAHDAGIPKSVKLAEVPVITLGVNDVSPLDQARAYATIAAQGIEATPYLVGSVRTPGNKVVYRAKKDTHRAFDADVMADTTYAMTKVLDCGSGGTACGKALTGRPAAGKTGTNGERTGNKDAWFIGFTPQLSTAVWYGNVDRQKPVTTHGSPLYGGDLPAATWQQMMDAALAGQPVKSFPPPAHVGTAQGATPSTGPSTVSPTPSTTPTKATPTPKLTTPPSPAPPTNLPPVTPSSPPPATSSPTSQAGGGGNSSSGPGAQRSPPG